jgi:hypothetical protein
MELNGNYSLYQKKLCVLFVYLQYNLPVSYCRSNRDHPNILRNSPYILTSLYGSYGCDAVGWWILLTLLQIVSNVLLDFAVLHPSKWQFSYSWLSLWEPHILCKIWGFRGSDQEECRLVGCEGVPSQRTAFLRCYVWILNVMNRTGSHILEEEHVNFQFCYNVCISQARKWIGACKRGVFQAVYLFSY